MSSSKKEVLELKTCCACKKEKEIKSFYRNAAMPSGWESRCKLCKKTGVKCRASKDDDGRKKNGKTRNSPQLWNVCKQDWIDTYDFLKSIGYDLHTNIHEQFCLKHNLKPRPRMKEKSKQYSPKELGMV